MSQPRLYDSGNENNDDIIRRLNIMKNTQSHNKKPHIIDSDDNERSVDEQQIHDNVEAQERLHILAEEFHSAYQGMSDIAQSFSMDISSHLAEYTKEVQQITINFNENDHGLRMTLNFAEASQILESSAKLYTKKVDHLHDVILKLLDAIQQQDNEAQGRRNNEMSLIKSGQFGANRPRGTGAAGNKGSDTNPFSYEDQTSLLLRPLQIEPHLKHDYHSTLTVLAGPRLLGNEGNNDNADDAPYNHIITSVYDGEHPPYVETRIETLLTDPPVSLLSTESSLLSVAKTIPSNGYRMTTLPIHHNGTFLLQTTNTTQDPTSSTNTQFQLLSPPIHLLAGTDTATSGVLSISHPFSRMQWVCNTLLSPLPQFQSTTASNVEKLPKAGKSASESIMEGEKLKTNQKIHSSAWADPVVMDFENYNNPSITRLLLGNGLGTLLDVGDDMMEAWVRTGAGVTARFNEAGDFAPEFGQILGDFGTTLMKFPSINNGDGTNHDFSMNDDSHDIAPQSQAQPDTNGSQMDDDAFAPFHSDLFEEVNPPDPGPDGADYGDAVIFEDNGAVRINTEQFEQLSHAQRREILQNLNELDDYGSEDGIQSDGDEYYNNQDSEDDSLGADNFDHKESKKKRDLRDSSIKVRKNLKLSHEIMLRIQVGLIAKDPETLADLWSHHTLSKSKVPHSKNQTKFHFNKIKLLKSNVVETIAANLQENSEDVHGFPQQSYYLYEFNLSGDFAHPNKMIAASSTNFDSTFVRAGNSSYNSHSDKIALKSTTSNFFSQAPQLLLHLLSESSIGSHNSYSVLQRNREREINMASVGYNYVIDRPEKRLFGTEYYLQSSQRSNYLEDTSRNKTLQSGAFMENTGVQFLREVIKRKSLRKNGDSQDLSSMISPDFEMDIELCGDNLFANVGQEDFISPEVIQIIQQREAAQQHAKVGYNGDFIRSSTSAEAYDSTLLRVKAEGKDTMSAIYEKALIAALQPASMSSSLPVADIIELDNIARLQQIGGDNSETKEDISTKADPIQYQTIYLNDDSGDMLDMTFINDGLGISNNVDVKTNCNANASNDHYIFLDPSRQYDDYTTSARQGDLINILQMNGIQDKPPNHDINCQSDFGSFDRYFSNNVIPNLEDFSIWAKDPRKSASVFQTACVSHIHEYIALSKAFEPQREADLLLQSWEARMEQVLNNDNTSSRAFDATDYGNDVIRKVGGEVDTQTSLNHLLSGESPGEACRIFLASLFLANQKNIEFTQPEEKDWTTFDGKDVDVKVLKINVVREEFEELGNLEQTSVVRGAEAPDAVKVRDKRSKTTSKKYSKTTFSHATTRKKKVENGDEISSVSRSDSSLSSFSDSNGEDDRARSRRIPQAKIHKRSNPAPARKRRREIIDSD